MPRRPSADQFDLFAHTQATKLAQMPQWHTLPAEARLALIRLMVRLILDHVADRAPERKEARHDV